MQLYLLLSYSTVYGPSVFRVLRSLNPINVRKSIDHAQEVVRCAVHYSPHSSFHCFVTLRAVCIYGKNRTLAHATAAACREAAGDVHGVVLLIYLARHAIHDHTVPLAVV